MDLQELGKLLEDSKFDLKVFKVNNVEVQPNSTIPRGKYILHIRRIGETELFSIKLATSEENYIEYTDKDKTAVKKFCDSNLVFNDPHDLKRIENFTKITREQIESNIVNQMTTRASALTQAMQWTKRIMTAGKITTVVVAKVAGSKIAATKAWEDAQSFKTKEASFLSGLSDDTADNVRHAIEGKNLTSEETFKPYDILYGRDQNMVDKICRWLPESVKCEIGEDNKKTLPSSFIELVQLRFDLTQSSEGREALSVLTLEGLKPEALANQSFSYDNFMGNIPVWNAGVKSSTEKITFPLQPDDNVTWLLTGILQNRGVTASSTNLSELRTYLNEGHKIANKDNGQILLNASFDQSVNFPTFLVADTKFPETIKDAVTNVNTVNLKGVSIDVDEALPWSALSQAQKNAVTGFINEHDGLYFGATSDADKSVFLNYMYNKHIVAPVPSDGAAALTASNLPSDWPIQMSSFHKAHDFWQNTFHISTAHIHDNIFLTSLFKIFHVNLLVNMFAAITVFCATTTTIVGAWWFSIMTALKTTIAGASLPGGLSTSIGELLLWAGSGWPAVGCIISILVLTVILFWKLTLKKRTDKQMFRLYLEHQASLQSEMFFAARRSKTIGQALDLHFFSERILKFAFFPDVVPYRWKTSQNIWIGEVACKGNSGVGVINRFKSCPRNLLIQLKKLTTDHDSFDTFITFVTQKINENQNRVHSKLLSSAITAVNARYKAQGFQNMTLNDLAKCIALHLVLRYLAVSAEKEFKNGAPAQSAMASIFRRNLPQQDYELNANGLTFNNVWCMFRGTGEITLPGAGPLFKEMAAINEPHLWKTKEQEMQCTANNVDGCTNALQWVLHMIFYENLLMKELLMKKGRAVWYNRHTESR